MFKIAINDQHYHVNMFSDEEKSAVKNIYDEMLAKYPKTDDFVCSTLAPLGLNESASASFMHKVVFAFCHTLNECNCADKQQYLKNLKSTVNLFLPYVVANEKIFHGSHCIGYEPISVACIYASGYFYGGPLDEILADEATEPYEACLLLESINLSRALKSMLFLLTIGDDAHAMAVYRGALEILAKIVLSGNNREEYARFKQYNSYLQYQKANGEKLPDEMVEYLNGCPEYKKSNAENFLAYGWAKNAKGERILSLKELLQTALGKDSVYLKSYHVASEFVHEDYVAVGYNYVLMREQIANYCYVFYHQLINEVLDGVFTKNEQKKNGLATIKNLFATVDKYFNEKLQK